MKKVIIAMAIVVGSCGCSNDVCVREDGIINCQYTYSDDYEFDSIHTNDTTNGCREVVITLKKVEK